MASDTLTVTGRKGTQFTITNTITGWEFDYDSSPDRLERLGDAFDAVCDALLAARREWVPVEDGWPTTDGWYVLADKGHVNGIGHYLASGPAWMLINVLCKDLDLRDVTHWMPLPSPPKGTTP